jgi:hypothetical protein
MKTGQAQAQKVGSKFNLAAPVRTSTGAELPTTTPLTKMTLYGEWAVVRDEQGQDHYIPGNTQVILEI